MFTGSFPSDFKWASTFEVHQYLALVIHRTTRKDFSVADRRIKGFRDPQIKRIDGLHIIMPIAEDRRLTGSPQPFSVGDGVS
jgi:hypothetical protein